MVNESMTNYSKYYDLEKYLFSEVAANFNAKGFLNTDEFFSIIIWKANRAKSKIARKFDKEVSLDFAIKKLTSAIFKADNLKEKLAVLINDYGFYLPMASAILSVLYSDRFSVYDIRVCDMLELEYKTDKYHRIKNWKFDRLWIGYLEYLEKVLELSNKRNFRDADKFLWGKSFYEQLKINLDTRFQ